MPKINTIHPEYLTEEQVLHVAKHCRNKDDAMLVKLLFYTGGRISEVLAVKPQDIDFEQARIKLPALKRSRVVKRKKMVIRRKPPTYKFAVIPNYFLSELKEFTRGKPEDKKLFNISRQLAYARIRIASIKTGIQGVYCHLLRDSLATNWALKGGDLTKLQRQLGHASLATTTDRYIRYSTADIREEVARIFE